MLEQFLPGVESCVGRSGGEYRALLLTAVDTVESCVVAVGGLGRDWGELEGLEKVHLQLEQLGTEIRTEVN